MAKLRCRARTRMDITEETGKEQKVTKSKRGTPNFSPQRIFNQIAMKRRKPPRAAISLRRQRSRPVQEEPSTPSMGATRTSAIGIAGTPLSSLELGPARTDSRGKDEFFCLFLFCQAQTLARSRRWRCEDVLCGVSLAAFELSWWREDEMTRKIRFLDSRKFGTPNT